MPLRLVSSGMIIFNKPVDSNILKPTDGFEVMIILLISSDILSGEIIFILSLSEIKPLKELISI